MARPGWQGQVSKAKIDLIGTIGLMGQKPKFQRPKDPKAQRFWTNGISRLKREPGQARALAKIKLYFFLPL